MTDPGQFGDRLRREREQRGISLDALAAATKVSVDLWMGLERNDLSRWPSGIFARAFVRDYARTIGLDAEAVVDEFCRQFSLADRRTTRIVEAQAELIGHDHQAIAPDPLPGGRERRRARRDAEGQAPVFRTRYAPRLVVAAIDSASICGAAIVASRLTGVGFLVLLGPASMLYYGITTVATGSTLGSRTVEALRAHAPALFTSHVARST